jgi:hypothetical protein
VTSQLIRSESRTVPGGTAAYSVWIWSTVPSRRVTATVYTAGKAMHAPTFGLCPSRRGSTCSIGSLPAYQAFELLVSDYIGKKASVGEQITMTVAVQGEAQGKSGGPLSPAEAGVSALVGPASSSTSPGSGTSLPPTSIPGLPGTTVTPGDLNSLFPTVTPASAPPNGHNRASSKHKVARLTTASSLPLDPRLIGGQLAGLAVLATAITMVVARLSLRTPQAAGPSGPAPSPQSPSPQTPAPQAPEPQAPEPQGEAAASEAPEPPKPTES